LEHDGNVIRAVDAKGEIIAQQVVDNNGEALTQVAVR